MLPRLSAFCELVFSNILILSGLQSLRIGLANPGSMFTTHRGLKDCENRLAKCRKSRLHYWFLFFLILMPPLLEGSDRSPRCFHKIQREIFNFEAVGEALNLNQVSQGQWLPISQELERRAKDIPRLMSQQAKRIKPNPLSSPFQAEVAEKLFYQIAKNIFVSVMIQYPIHQHVDLSQAFDYIYRQKKEALKACLNSGDTVQ